MLIENFSLISQRVFVMRCLRSDTQQLLIMKFFNIIFVLLFSSSWPGTTWFQKWCTSWFISFIWSDYSQFVLKLTVFFYRTFRWVQIKDAELGWENNKICLNVKSHYFDHEKSPRKEKDKLRVWFSHVSLLISLKNN